MRLQKQIQNTWTNSINILQKSSLNRLLIFLLLSSGCGSYSESLNPKNNIDPEFNSLVQKFEQEQNETVYVDITFKKIEPPAVGLCWRYEESKTGVSIEIDPDYWFSTTETKKEVLLFHELGHCILGRDHEEEKLYYTIPKSIMFPYVFETSYLLYRSYYVDELKNTNTLLTDYLE